MDLSHVLSYLLEPQLLGQNLSKIPLQTWWDLKDIAEQEIAEQVIFDYLELLYKGVYIHTAQRCSLNPLNTFPTPKVKDPDEEQFLEILPFWILFPLFIVSYSLSSNHFCHVTYFRTWHKKTYIYGRFQKRVINALKLHHCMRHLKYNTQVLRF